MMMKKLFVISSLLISAVATAQHSPLSYDYVQAGIVQTDFADIPPFDARGFELKASKELGYGFFGEATYFDTSDDKNGLDFDADKWEVAVGYIHRFSSKTVFDYQVGYGDIELGLSNGEESVSTGTNYYMAEANVRHSLNANWELFAGLEWQFWDEGSDQKAYNLGAQYHWDAISVGAEYTKFSDSQVFGLFARYQF